MVVMQKLKLMQEFTLAIDVKCLHRHLPAMSPMTNCTRANRAKHVNEACRLYKSSRVEISEHDAHIQQQHINLFFFLLSTVELRWLEH